MAKTNLVFMRNEKKYILTEEQYTALKARISARLKPDAYPHYTICNVYFDTDDYDLIRRSIDKPVFKEKLRLRSYGVPSYTDNVFLEIKRKYKGVVSKRRIVLTLGEATNYLERGILPKNRTQCFKEIDYFKRFYNAKPKMYLSYDREAFCDKDDSDIRITFDSRLICRETALSLEYGVFGEPIIPAEYRLMEIKVPSALPLYLTRALNDLKIYPIGFSKYGTAYKNKLLKETNKKCLAV